ncbi:uncharacterized protein EAF01_006935 [Botrytis porri]|uniref:Uncharacterized protein n=1 Tax=Botrytis porri TaxID=87229 RepID=A0A4Z1K9X0_9HELO|nr:uncharacterized protein EAF01_006935 [Botrytis porri]KAF7901636.1 hypothetical protein EAF01_006935 [Botrytis porri]TGO82248.1 hypothetical protein BPOR_0880g00040 [Botrytis porri]
MANYTSRRPEMLDRLYEEGRSNMVYRYAFKDAQNSEAIALLPEQEKLQAIERAVYKKLFGGDLTDKKDTTKNANFMAEPKKNDVSQSNHRQNPGKSATPVAKKKNDTQEARGPVDSNTTKVVAGISHRDQAAKTPPPDESQLTDRQKRVLILAVETARRDAILDKRNRLLPMRPGGIIEQFSTYAQATSDCEYCWFAEDGAQMKEVERKLDVKVMFVFEKSHRFRLWPEPADWDAFEKDHAEGMELLARCEIYMEFWVWIFTSTGRVTDRIPLTSCLE